MVLALTASLVLSLPATQAAPTAAPTAAPAPTSPPASAPATAPAAAPASAPGTTVPQAEALAQHRAQSQPTLNGPSQVPANTPALRQMSRERDSLELVEQTAHHALQDATHRIAAMHAFIERQNLAGALAAYARNFQPLGSQITFETAMRAALDHLATRPPTAPTTDLLHLEQAIEVESATAHSTFNLLNSARRNVELLGSFLARQRLLPQYRAWSQQAARAAGHAPKQLSDPAALAAAQDRRALQLAWDRLQQAQDAEYPPAVAPGTAVAHGPYASSWWNSYADPYYDLAGYPGRDPSLARNAPPPDYGSQGAPADYDWAISGYERNGVPVYPELGPNVVPAFGMFPSGAAGGTTFGGRGGAVGGGGAAGGGGAR